MHSITFILNHISFFHAFVSSLTFETQSLAINIHKFLYSCTVRYMYKFKKKDTNKGLLSRFIFISKKIFRITVEYLFEIISIFYSNRIDVLFTLYRYIYTYTYHYRLSIKLSFFLVERWLVDLILCFYFVPRIITYPFVARRRNRWKFQYRRARAVASKY